MFRKINVCIVLVLIMLSLVLMLFVNMKANEIMAKFDLEKSAITQPVTLTDYIIVQRVSFYNPLDPNQTDDSPGICAWNYKYQPGDNIIAISRDLLSILGNGSKVRIHGLPEELPKIYIVRDKTAARWESTIDIAFPFGDNIDERKSLAKEYGIMENLKLEILKEEI